MRHEIRWLRPAALAALLAWGCQTTRPISLAELPREPIAQARVALTLVSGDEVVLRNASLRGAEIVGESQGTPPTAGWTTWRQRSIPVDDVQAVEVRERSTGRTLLFLAGTAVAAFGVILWHDYGS